MKQAWLTLLVRYREREFSASLNRFALSALAMVPALCMTAAPGCTPHLKPIFEEHVPPIVWPPEPAAPRIRYLGQLQTSADLKPRRKLFQGIGDWLVGPKPTEPIYGPRSVVCTADGSRVWVADPGGRCLHEFDLEKRTYVKITQLDGIRLCSPVGISLGPGGSLFVCDSEAIAIYQLDAATGALRNSLKLPEDLVRPIAVRFDGDAGELYVVDVGAHNVKVLSPSGALLRILGQRGTRAGEFNYPCDVAFHDEILWISDAGNHRVQGLNSDGRPRASFGQAGDAPGDLALPKGLSLDSEGHIYVTDGRFENLQVFDSSGQLLLILGGEGTGPGEFWLPGGVYVDALDRIWVCDTYNRRLQVFQYLKEPVSSEMEEQP